MDLVIRRAETADIDALSQFYVEFHNFHALGVPTHLAPVGEADDDLRQAVGKLLADATCAIFVAVLDDAIVGFAEIYSRATNPAPALVERRYAHLQSLAVTEPHRRHGLGRKLLAVAHQWAQEQGATTVELETWEFPAGPLRFYEGLGYSTRKRLLTRPL